MTAPVSSRGALGWLGAALGGSLSAAAFAVALAHAETMLVFCAYIAPFPLFFTALGAGAVGGIVAALFGTCVLAVIVSPAVALVFSMIFAFPAAVLSALALRHRSGEDGRIYWYPEGYLLTALTLYPVMMFLVAMAATSGHDGGLLGMTKGALDAVTKQISVGIDAEQAAAIGALMGRIPPLLPALIGCSWLFLTLISAVAAQGGLRQQGWQIRPQFTLRDLHIPHWLIIAAAVTGLAGFLAPAPYDYAGGNICFMLCVPFALVGIAVVHAYAASRTKGRVAALIAFYVLLGILPWLVVLVALLGALDQILNFRRRFATPQKPV